MSPRLWPGSFPPLCPAPRFPRRPQAFPIRSRPNGSARPAADRPCAWKPWPRYSTGLWTARRPSIPEYACILPRPARPAVLRCKTPRERGRSPARWKAACAGPASNGAAVCAAHPPAPWRPARRRPCPVCPPSARTDAGKPPYPFCRKSLRPHARSQRCARFGPAPRAKARKAPAHTRSSRHSRRLSAAVPGLRAAAPHCFPCQLSSPIRSKNALP